MIPLSVPHLAGNEWKYVKDCLDTGWVSSVGAYVMQFENMVAEFAGAKYGVACVNGTNAIHIALVLAGVSQGDYVIVPNITFIASANAIKYTGANPILIDVDAQDWQMDLNVLESFLAAKTVVKEGKCYFKADNRCISAILPVHVLGNIGDAERLVQIAEKHKIAVVEDSTEALGSTFNGKHAGTFGRIGTFSFNGNKIITTGGGGVIVTNNAEIAQKAKHLTTQAKADPFEYYHDEIGYNYRLVNILAAMGVAQMEQLPEFILKKKSIDAAYRAGLAGVGDVEFQKINPEVNHNCWLITIKTSRSKELLAYLNNLKIQSRPFWIPMNQLPMFKDDIYVQNADVSKAVYENCLSIPSSVGITDSQLNEVIEAIKTFYKG